MRDERHSLHLVFDGLDFLVELSDEFVGLLEDSFEDGLFGHLFHKEVVGDKGVVYLRHYLKNLLGEVFDVVAMLP